MLSVIILFVIIPAVSFVFWLLNIRKFEKKVDHIKGPKPLPILGNALDVYKTDILLNSLMRYEKEFKGQLTKLRIGMDRYLVVVYDYELIEKILTSVRTIEKSPDYYSLHSWLGFGLLTSSGEKWRSRRKLLTPTFHFQILEHFIDVFDKKSDILVESLKSQVNKQSVNIYDYVTLCTLDVICESAMGTSVNAQLNKDSEYVKCVKEMGRIVMERTTHPFKQYNFFYKLSKDYQKELKALKILHGFTNSVIQQRKELVLKNGVSNLKQENQDDGLNSKKRHAFLDLLLMTTTPDGKSLSDDDIREEVDTFMFEGHDTTSSCISFAFFLLAKHPEVQEKCHQEIIDILGDDRTKEVTHKDLTEMKYLDSVINESLRLYPSVPIIGRQLTEDLEFRGDIYPKGLTFLIPPFVIQRSDRFYENPEKFDPERFNSENKIGRKPFSHIPFSAGPRNCIGQKFAMLEIKSTLSKVIRHFILEEAKDFEPILCAETILKSLNGIYIKIKNRP